MPDCSGALKISCPLCWSSWPSSPESSWCATSAQCELCSPPIISVPKRENHSSVCCPVLFSVLNTWIRFNKSPRSNINTCPRFTKYAENVSMKLVEKKVYTGLEHEKQVCLLQPYLILDIMQILCSKLQVLIYKLKRYSEISAFGFFTIDRTLFTSFLATTFTLWVILVQFVTN